MTLAPGKRLGPYEIVGPLGAGGMGEVYRARDTRLEREVAVKVLPAALRADPDARARFRREALALSRLNHPNIEMVLDLGEAEGTDWIVLELVPGETLAARIARGRIPEREAAELGAQVAEALTEAHERGVLHRDLKPGNVMVTPKGRAKVLDFGLARLEKSAAEETATQDMTRVGTTTGTLAYMAPEQLLGEPVDGRADLWALGVVLYEMTTARRPFQGALATALANDVLHGRIAAPRSHEPSLSARAEAIVLRALERDRERRYQTAAEMLGELRRLAAEEVSDPAAPVPGMPPARRVTSIAVLPLENLSGDPSQEYFSDGMTEELIASLAQVRALRVVSRHAVMRYKGQHPTVAEVARELNVDAVVEGSVRRGGDRVRITAQLIEAASEHHLWAHSYEREMKEVLALQGEVAAAIVQEIRVSVTPQEETRLKGARTVDPHAYEAYLKGRHLIEQRTEEAFRAGLALLEEAVRLDPALELAHVGVADAHNLMGFMTMLPPRETFPRAAAAARRALELNPASGEAHTSLAYATLWHDWDLVEAERLFRRAVDLNPKYPQVHLWLTNLLLAQERYEEAEAEGAMARTLDPFYNVARAHAGWLSHLRGRFAEACGHLHALVEALPGFGMGYFWFGLSLARAGRDAEAIANLRRAVEMLGRTPMALSALATAHALAGRGAEARSLLAELAGMAPHRYVAAYYVAQVLVALGDRDAAFTKLEAAIEERVHWMLLVHFDPSLAALRDDPRFASLVARVRGKENR